MLRYLYKGVKRRVEPLVSYGDKVFQNKSPHLYRTTRLIHDELLDVISTIPTNMSAKKGDFITSSILRSVRKVIKYWPNGDRLDYRDLKEMDLYYDPDLNTPYLNGLLQSAKKKLINHESYTSNYVNDLNEYLKMNDKKIGIAIPGGTFNCTMVMGYLMALRKSGLNIDSIVGSSAGAWSMLSYAYGKSIENVFKANVKCFSEDLYKHHSVIEFLKSNVKSNLPELRNLADIRNSINLDMPINNFTERMYAIAYEHIDLSAADDIDTNMLINLTTINGDRIVLDVNELPDKETILKYMLSSCANPAITSFYFKDDDGTLLVDGVFNDYYNIKNIELLKKNNVDKIIAITFREEDKEVLEKKFKDILVINLNGVNKSSWTYTLESCMENFAIHGIDAYFKNLPNIIDFVKKK